MKLLTATILALTVALGFAANVKPRRGALIWEDNFNSFDKSTWKHLITGWVLTTKQYPFSIILICI